MISTHQLTKRFGSTLAVSDLSLQIAPGEIFCLLGANGAGKSTTINLLLGFLTPTSGRAAIGGVDVVSETLKARSMIAYIPEQVALYDQLTGLENLAYFAGLSRSRPVEVEECHRLLRKVGLPEEAAGRYVATYSKGMRQKVGIALAWARQARVLLLDEPTSGLDPEASDEFSRLLRAASDEGVTTFMATHDLFRAKELGGRVGIMRRGSLVESMDTEDISHRDLEQLYLNVVRAA
jgi:ABC-2 type transport system ATP-binding protein